MQTYTHFVVGGALGAAVFPHDFVTQLACAAGATFPDIPLVIQFAYDKLKGVPPMSNESRFTVLAKRATHSIAITAIFSFLLVGVAGLLKSKSQVTLTLIFLMGIASHICIDMATHKNGESDAADNCFYWPFSNAKNEGLWDYRIGPGILRPKPFEQGFLGVFVLFWVVYPFFAP